ncbi:MAG: hypothetical protein R3C14_32915 [Caldilineaceae bacterium]
MSEVTVTPTSSPVRPLRWLKYALQALVLLPVIAGFLLYRAWTAPATDSSVALTGAVGQNEQSTVTIISAQTLEERFGLRVAMIAITGGGGIVDFRYRILDKDKAQFLLNDPNNAPVLTVEGSDIRLMPPSHASKHSARLENNKTYFNFYPNTQNALQPGSRVVVVMGSLRLEPIVVQ